MKILFLSTWFPLPADTGARIRVYNLIKSIAGRHKLYLITLLQPDADLNAVDQLNEMCEVISVHKAAWFQPTLLKTILGAFSRKPRSLVESYDPSVAESVSKAIEKVNPDIIIVSGLMVADYVPRGIKIPCVLEEHNCWTAVLKRAAQNQSNPLVRLKRWFGWHKFAKWEAAICRRLDAISEVSDVDKKHLLELAPDLRNIFVIPNGVDTSHYDPDTWNPKPLSIVYNGSLTFSANLDAIRFYCSEIYPLLSAKIPGIVLRVTGRTDGIDLSDIGDHPGIELTGHVDDIRGVLSTSAACVVPLREGGGSRLKILEAMAAGVPVISTTIGAEGLNVKDGEHLLTADSPQELAESVERVLNDDALAQTLRNNARRLVESKYSWSVIGKSFLDVLDKVKQ